MHTHTHTHTHTHSQRKTTVKDCNFCKRTKKAGEKAFSHREGIFAKCCAVRSECQQKDWGMHKDACAPREKISRELGDRAGESTVLGSLGATFHSLGQFDKAIEFHTKSQYFL